VAVTCQQETSKKLSRVCRCQAGGEGWPGGSNLGGNHSPCGLSAFSRSLLLAPWCTPWVPVNYTQPVLGEGSTLLSAAHTSSGRGSHPAPGDPPEGHEARRRRGRDLNPTPFATPVSLPVLLPQLPGSPSSALAAADPPATIHTEMEIWSKHRKSACAEHAATKDIVSLCTFYSRSDWHALVRGSHQLEHLKLLTNPRTW
jgi:hypothetical protein